MAEVKWIKLSTEVFDNRKIKQIEILPDGDSIIVIWFKILCLAGNTNDNGFVYFTHDIPYTDQMLAAEFNRPLTTIQIALNIFERFGMIDIVDNIIHVSSWEKYQNVDGLEKIKEQNRLRQAKYKEKQKLLSSNVTGNVTVPLPVTLGNGTDIDIDKDIDIDIDKKKNNSRFTPPTLDEVRNYCKERNNTVDCERWYDFYESKGWMIGKNKMKDWKAAVRTWEKKSKDQSEKPTNNNKFNNFPQRDYTPQDMLSMEQRLLKKKGL